MRHALIQHRFREGDFGCGMEGVRLEGGAVGLAGGARVGTLESASIMLPFECREMALTWNARTPPGAWLDVRFSVGDAAGWSVWYEMGEWGRASRAPRVSEDARFGRLEVDALKAAAPFDRVRYRVGFGSAGGEGAALRAVRVCSSGEGGEEVAWKPPAGGGLALDVPWLSQFRREVVWDEAMMKAGVCAPTSLTMVLRHLGCRVSVYEAAKMARDEGAGIFGNWAYLAAAAGEFGLSAWVERHSAWDGLLARLREGVAPILSTAWEKGTFSRCPERSSKGHLMVLRGWTGGGELICNDPGVEDERDGRGAIFPAEELGRAFFGHGGVAVIVGREAG